MPLRALVRAACLWLALLPAAAPADAPRVAADIAPIHSLAAQVMEGAGAPDLILPPGASPHGYALRPSEAAALERADVVFVQGGGLTPWLDGAIEILSGDARVVALIDMPGTTRLPYREDAVFGEGEDGRDHDREKEHGHEDEHGHDRSGLDPHAWLDPENARVWVRAMAEVLAEQDPANADLYRANAERAQDEIGAAAIRVAHFIAPLRETRFVVFHDALQYFENRYGLRALGAISASDAGAPGPARLAGLRAALAESGVSCVLAEPQFDPGLIEAVTAGDTNTGVVDPMGADIPPGPDFYIQLMNHVAGVIGGCL